MVSGGAVRRLVAGERSSKCETSGREHIASPQQMSRVIGLTVRMQEMRFGYSEKCQRTLMNCSTGSVKQARF